MKSIKNNQGNETLIFAETFEYEVVASENGNATIIKFPVDEKLNSPGDVVVVVSGENISFHGMIGKIEDGYAYVADPKGSLLSSRPAQGADGGGVRAQAPDPRRRRAPP